MVHPSSAVSVTTVSSTSSVPRHSRFDLSTAARSARTAYRALSFTHLSRTGAHKARSLFTWTGIAHQLVAAVEQRADAAVALHDTEWDEPWNDGD